MNVFGLAEELGVTEDVIEKTKAERNALFRDRIAEGVEMIDGVRETLEALHGHLPMAVVTSSWPENLNAMHRDHGLEVSFFSRAGNPKNVSILRALSNMLKDNV